MAGVSVTSVTLSLAAQTLGPIGSGFGLWGHSQDAFVDLCSPQLPGFSTPLAPLMAPRGGSGGIVVRAGPPPPSGLSAVPGPHGLHTPAGSRDLHRPLHTACRAAGPRTCFCGAAGHSPWGQRERENPASPSAPRSRAAPFTRPLEHPGGACVRS